MYLRLDQTMEVEDDENLVELSFVSSAVSEPRWALHMCDKKCKAKSFKFYELAASVTEEESTTRTINLCRNWCEWRKARQR